MPVMEPELPMRRSKRKRNKEQNEDVVMQEEVQA
jgi:hypothetical protein